MFQNPNDRQGQLPAASGAPPAAFASLADWPAYGGTWDGLKYSPLTQINPQNAARLDVAWHYHTGDLKAPSDPGEFTYEMTPIKVGNLLYLCTPHDMVIALDPVTGKTAWKFDPQVQVKGTQHMSCRGVSYYDSAAAPGWMSLRKTLLQISFCSFVNVSKTSSARRLSAPANPPMPR